ncbi:uncharacterized protein LOC110861074 isoform X2 [Folsomia candida]|uniref:uncharacterized protein LOC110861074 isoform X2 n=1 Tax=Folsomia candida TaxID=158441 RepID=UPI0016055520|nr:uncharacterized protein LOC110861074 isoform X2 [Folsomia candida]
MFSSEYRVPIKIGDFGQCRILPHPDNPTLTKSDIGTRVYRAPEVLSGKYSYQSDLYSLGLIIWEVVDLIKESEINSLFDKLVADGAIHLVTDNHPLIGNLAKELVINLTERHVKKRYQTIDDVDRMIDNWKSVQIMRPILKCRNGEDLELCLSFSFPNCIIVLGEGDYQGRFIVSHNNVRLMGRGVDKTRIKSSFSFDICGNNCKFWNLSISPTNTLNFSLNITGSRNRLQGISASGINVSGSECTLTDIAVDNAVNGIQICGSDNNIDGVTFTNISNQYIVLGEYSNNCIVSGVSVKDNGKLTLQPGTSPSQNLIFSPQDDINPSELRDTSLVEDVPPQPGPCKAKILEPSQRASRDILADRNPHDYLEI